MRFTSLALALMLIVGGCVSSETTTGGSEPGTAPSTAPSTAVPTSVTAVSPPTTSVETTVADRAPTPDAATVFDTQLDLNPAVRPAYATNGEVHILGGWTESGSSIEVHALDEATVHPIEGLLDAAGSFAEVSAIEHWQGLFWVFVQGDTGTDLGVASVLVSADGREWERREVGSTATGARSPGGFATPDVPQYEGASGVTSAASVPEGRLVAAGWTRTDAGVQPVIWSTTDAITWTTDVLPNKAQSAEMAMRVAVGDEATVVHTIGGFYFGQDLWLLHGDDERDVSLVGEQVVMEIAASADRFVMTTAAFGAPPTGMWEWFDGAWNSIAPPEWQPSGDEIAPFHIRGSSRGAVVFGSSDIGIRRDGSWVHLASFDDPISAATIEGDHLWVLTSRGSTATAATIPLP